MSGQGWSMTNRAKLSACALIFGAAVVLPSIAPVSAAPACSPTETSIGGEVVVQFLTATTCDWVVPAGVVELSAVLIVGGGGGGGYDIGGGGGAGGVVELTNVAVSPGATITVTVGAGGVGNSGYATNPLSDGEDSTALSYSAEGGGAGGSGGETGKDGGSGGGAGYGAYGAKPGGSSTQAAPGVGYAGGATTGGESGGGGGGAGAVGGDADAGGNNQQGGNGGDGIASSITGSSKFYAGGGGGGSQPAGAGTTGGSGVGGNGGRVGGPEIEVGSGAANTGSGGGGGGSGFNPLVKNGGGGGSGIVVFRYAGSSAPAPEPEASVLKFRGNGGTCADAERTAENGTWATTPSKCVKPSSTLLGWATSPSFPPEVAARQIALGWGVIDGRFDGTRMIFIPAGMPTWVTGETSLYAIWG